MNEDLQGLLQSLQQAFKDAKEVKIIDGKQLIELNLSIVVIIAKLCVTSVAQQHIDTLGMNIQVRPSYDRFGICDGVVIYTVRTGIDVPIRLVLHVHDGVIYDTSKKGARFNHYQSLGVCDIEIVRRVLESQLAAL